MGVDFMNEFFIKFRNRWVLYIINISIAGIVISYQACSPQKYSLELQSVGLPPKCKTGECKTGQINPQLDSHRPPTKVLFVVDNSRTMELSQKYLAEGVKTLASSLKGFDANFYIYTTTDSHKDKLDSNGNPRFTDDKPLLSSTPAKNCQWSELDPKTGLISMKTGGECPNNQPISYNSETLYSLNNSLVTDLQLRSGDDESKIEETSRKLASAITNVGIDGSSTETGICSLVRAVYNDAANGIFKKGDNAAMVVLSDENDSSSPLSCLSRTTKEETFNGKKSEMASCNPSTENCDTVDYEVKYNAINEIKNYGKVSMDYKCQTLSTPACDLNTNCSSVVYTFQNLRKKSQYTCLSEVKYEVSYKDLPAYSKTLSYQCQEYSDGVAGAISDIKSVANFSTSNNCLDGSEVVCDSAAQSAASLKCLGSSRLVVNSCKLKCVAGSKAIASDVYSDTDPTADKRDLSSAPLDYIVKDWAKAKHPSYVVESILRKAVVATAVADEFVNLNCSSANLTYLDCSDTEKSNISKNKCGGKSVLSCKMSCKGDSKSLALAKPKTEDVVNFCDNTNSLKKFAAIRASNSNTVEVPTGSSTTYTNVQELASALIFPGQVSTITNCKRVGYGANTYIAGSLKTTSSVSLPGICSTVSDYSSVINTANLCTGSGEKNGITEGSEVYRCANESKSILVTPEETKKYTHTASKAGNNICMEPFKVDGVSYASLPQYLRQLPNGRSEDAATCLIKSAKKSMVPPGVVSAKKSEKQWTFPKNIEANSGDANLGKAFVTRSSELFGDNGYFLSGIIRDPKEDAKETECSPLGADQSYGDKYFELINMIATKTTASLGDVTSICAKDYSKSLSSVSDWITSTARRSYYVPEVSAEDEILAVSLADEKSGEEKTLTLGVDYEVVGNKINFINPNIDPKGWLIKYTYWQPFKNPAP